MAKFTFNSQNKSNNIIHIKEAKYIKRYKLWRNISIFSIVINFVLLILTTIK